MPLAPYKYNNIMPRRQVSIVIIASLQAVLLAFHASNVIVDLDVNVLLLRDVRLSVGVVSVEGCKLHGKLVQGYTFTQLKPFPAHALAQRLRQVIEFQICGDAQYALWRRSGTRVMTMTLPL